VSTTATTTFAPVGPEPISGSIPKRRGGAEVGDTFEGVLSRTVSATLERPTMVVGVGFGMIGLGAMAAACVLLVGSLAFVWWQSSRVVEPAPLAIAEDQTDPVPLPAPSAPPPVAPAQDGTTASGSPPPVDPRPVAPRPAAPPLPAPTVAPPPATVTVVETAPAPVKVVAPAPPAPKATVEGQNATVMLVGQSKVLVEFKGPNGTTRARSLPPGQYDVVAWFGGKPSVVESSTNFLSAGGTYRLNCSDLMQTCTWVK
jgi:hypothetical protein